MRVEIQLTERLAGFAASAARGGQTVEVVAQEFTSSEDGDLFVARLEGLQQSLIRHVPGCPPPSAIDHLLAVIHPDLRVTIAVNDVERKATIRSKKIAPPGELITLDDILDIVGLQLDVPIPSDCGFVFIQSFGWRRSLFFDFVPLSTDAKPRDFDLEHVLGLQYGYLLFQELFKITDQQWAQLFAQGWFPFRFLPTQTIKTMLAYAAAGFSIDECLSEASVLDAIKAAADPGSGFFAAPVFEDHRELIAHAFERFRSADYKSAVAILYPRIEGILRSIQALGGGGSPSASGLIVSATQAFEHARGDATLLMPARFREFLTQVYFRGWRPGQTPAHVSRHTVSHGVAPPDLFDVKSAAVAVLTALQLGLYL